MEKNSKYEALNRISRAQRSDQKEARDELEAYLTQEYLVKEVFTLV